eukprot:scaffold269_cov404-Prasinococcus_capsulatus_cf.AAC.17
MASSTPRPRGARGAPCSFSRTRETRPRQGDGAGAAAPRRCWRCRPRRQLHPPRLALAALKPHGLSWRPLNCSLHQSGPAL